MSRTSRCIRVPKQEGERVRSELKAAGSLDLRSKIGADDGCLLIPILSDGYLDYETVTAELDERECRETDYRELLDLPPDAKEALPCSYDVIGSVVAVSTACSD